MQSAASGTAFGRRTGVTASHHRSRHPGRGRPAAGCGSRGRLNNASASKIATPIPPPAASCPTPDSTRCFRQDPQAQHVRRTRPPAILTSGLRTAGRGPQGPGVGSIARPRRRSRPRSRRPLPAARTRTSTSTRAARSLRWLSLALRCLGVLVSWWSRPAATLPARKVDHVAGPRVPGRARGAWRLTSRPAASSRPAKPSSGDADHRESTPPTARASRSHSTPRLS